MNEKERENLKQEIADIRRFTHWRPVALLGDAAKYIGIAYLALVLLLVYFGYLTLEVWW